MKQTLKIGDKYNSYIVKDMIITENYHKSILIEFQNFGFCLLTNKNSKSIVATFEGTNIKEVMHRYNTIEEGQNFFNIAKEIYTKQVV